LVKTETLIKERHLMSRDLQDLTQVRIRELRQWFRANGRCTFEANKSLWNDKKSRARSFAPAPHRNLTEAEDFGRSLPVTRNPRVERAPL
jgi:hypothetical protein